MCVFVCFLVCVLLFPLHVRMSGHTSVCVESEDILVHLSAFLSISFPVCLLASTCFLLCLCVCCFAPRQQHQTSINILWLRQYTTKNYTRKMLNVHGLSSSYLNFTIHYKLLNGFPFNVDGEFTPTSVDLLWLSLFSFRNITEKLLCPWNSECETFPTWQQCFQSKP